MLLEGVVLGWRGVITEQIPGPHSKGTDTVSSHTRVRVQTIVEDRVCVHLLTLRRQCLQN